MFEGMEVFTHRIICPLYTLESLNSPCAPYTYNGYNVTEDNLLFVATLTSICILHTNTKVVPSHIRITTSSNDIL